MSRVIVTDGHTRAALAVVRSLGAAGHEVHVTSSDRRCLAGVSRYCRSGHIVPDPTSGGNGYGDALATLSKELDSRWIVPMTDPSSDALLSQSILESLRPTRVPLATPDSYRKLSDKAEVLGEARVLGIPVPEEYLWPTPEHTPESGSVPAYPVVVKPAHSFVRVGSMAHRFSVCHARDEDEFRSVIRSYPAAAFPVLIQEYVEGVGEGIFILRSHGRTIARFAHRRLREKPPTGGVSVYRKSIPLPPDSLAHAERLLDATGHQGVAMVEFRRSVHDDTPYLMEVNARFWGSLQLAIDAGVDFPRLLIELAEGGAPEQELPYRVGIRSRWWLGDLDHLIIRLTGSTPDYRLPVQAGSRLRALGRFLVPWRPGDRSEVFRWSDPRPGIHELVSWVRENVLDRVGKPVHGGRS